MNWSTLNGWSFLAAAGSVFVGISVIVHVLFDLAERDRRRR